MQQPQPPQPPPPPPMGDAAGPGVEEAEAPLSALPPRAADPYADMLDTLNAEGSSMSIDVDEPRVA